MKQFYNFILLILLLSAFSLAQEQSPDARNELVARMNDLVQAGRYQEAYDLGQTALFDYEGEADFDFIYGLAAIETGEVSEAVFALERVAFTNRTQQRVQLELARAYFLSQNYAASETLFNEVLASTLPRTLETT